MKDRDTGTDAMYGRERRKDEDETAARLRAGLSAQQLRALDTLEQFKWTLKFVRRPLFQDPIPVVFDRGNDRYAVLRTDGTLDEHPVFPIRN